MRILFTCGREPEYTRNRLVLRAIAANHDVLAVVDSRSTDYLSRHLRLAARLIANRQQFDTAYVGFYGYLLVPLVRLLHRGPLVFDAYLSTYDTLCLDRRVLHPSSVAGKLVRLFDKWVCEMADVVVVDTEAQRGFFARTYGLDPKKIAVIYVGFEESFAPQPVAEGDHLLVFFYGSFLPVQGVEYIVKAAKLLEAERDVAFRIVGSGREWKAVSDLARNLKCGNIEFVDRVPYAELPGEIAKADICLGGHFSGNEKARNTISTKTFQFLGMARPTIVGRGPANRELFTDREDVLMCEMASAESLAESILLLRDDPALRARIGARGGEMARTVFSETAIRENLNAVLQGALTASRR